MLTADQVAQKWQRNTSAAGPSMTAGVQAVTTSPTAKAAQNLQAYLNGTQQAVQSGKMAAKLNAVSLQDWQTAMITKGVPRVAAGVAAALPKVTAFMQKWLPYEDGLKQKIAAMPKGTLADSQARANFAIQYNAAYSHRLVGS